jgi:hypothetical protein
MQYAHCRENNKKDLKERFLVNFRKKITESLKKYDLTG